MKTRSLIRDTIHGTMNFALDVFRELRNFASSRGPSKSEREIDEALKETFPASDPPSYGGTTSAKSPQS